MKRCEECGKVLPTGADYAYCDGCWEGTSEKEQPMADEVIEGLPEIDGTTPTKQSHAFVGGHDVSAANHAARAYKSTHFVVAMVEVSGVNHKEDADGKTRRVETLKIKRYGFMPPGEGATLVEQYAAKQPDELPLNGEQDDDDPEVT